MPADVAGRTKPGDRVVVEAHRVGATQRSGKIVEVLGEGEHEHYRVRWDDEGLSMRGAHAASAAGWRIGSMMRKQAPAPGMLRASMRPLCFFTMP